MKKSSDFRAEARAMLGGNIFNANWLMGLLVCLIVEAIASAVAAIGLGVGSILVFGPLGIGAATVFLAVARGQKEFRLENLFDGFTKGYVRNLLLGLMIGLFTFLWSLLFFIPGIIKLYSYSMSYYISIDHPEYSWSQCIDESQRLMSGNKMRLFLLDLSFIGWIIVGVLACGIGTLWVAPYMEAARACFYKDLVGESVVDNAEPAETI